LRGRRICFAFSTRKQQILRFAQDDTLREQFFSSLLEDHNLSLRLLSSIFRVAARLGIHRFSIHRSMRELFSGEW
jgi:hypothetical protein